MSNVNLSQLVGGKSCTVPCHIFNNGSRVSSFALADTGANTLALIDTQSAQVISQFLTLPIKRLPNPIVVRGFNGADAPPITSVLQLHVCIDRRRLYNVPFLITNLGGHHMILGRKWMSYLGVSLNVRRRRIVWPATLPPTPWFAKEISIPMRDLFCRSTNAQHQADVVRRDCDNTRLDIATLDPLQARQILPRPITTIPTTQADRGQLGKMSRSCLPIRTSLEKHTEHADRQASLRKMEQQFREPTGPECTIRPQGGRTTPRHQWPDNLPALDICVIGAVGFSRNLARPGATPFVTSLYEIDRILEERTNLKAQEDQDYQAQVNTKLLS